MAAVHLFYLLHGRGRQGEGAALLDKVLTGHDIAVQQAGKLAMQGLARIGQQAARPDPYTRFQAQANQTGDYLLERLEAHGTHKKQNGRCSNGL